MSESDSRGPTTKLFIALALVACVLLIPASAQAQATIKVNDNVSLRFGALLQGWADAAQVKTATADGYSDNLFLRRMRILIGGQISPNVSFFFETDNPNLGKAPKALNSGFITQDAFVEWKPKGQNTFMLDVGLMLPPLCRNCVESAATLLSLDYGTYSFAESAPTQSSVGRDTGIQAKGYLAGGHFEYRAGLFQGFRQPASATKVVSGNSLRLTARGQYNVFDTETGYTYPGCYLGGKHVLAIGAGMDHQDDYKAYSVDAFTAMPFAKNELNGEITIFKFDGGKFFPTVADQRDATLQVGYYLAGPKVMPWVRLESKDVRGSNTGDEKRQQIGATWYPNGHNFNVKGSYSRVDPKNGFKTNQFTVQVQFFYY